MAATAAMKRNHMKSPPKGKARLKKAEAKPKVTDDCYKTVLRLDSALANRVKKAAKKSDVSMNKYVSVALHTVLQATRS